MSVRIMLDPGHAGDFYNGSPVVSGYYESSMTWSLTQKLKTALEKRGFEVGLTRLSKYYDPSLTDRGAKAAGYDLFLSIHSNAASREDADSPWLIHLVNDEKTKIDEKSAEIARILGPVISSVMGVSDPYCLTKGVDFDRDGNGHLDDEYYGVLFGAKSVGVPGVILEHSFHTNRYAAQWLLGEANLEKLAEAEADALAKYYNMEDTSMTEIEKEAFDALVKKVEKLEHELEHTKIKYNWTTACPEWARETIHELTQTKLLVGDERGQLRLSEDMCRILVILHRAGAFE